MTGQKCRQIRDQADAEVGIEQGAQPEKRKKVIKFRDNVGFLLVLLSEGRKLNACKACYASTRQTRRFAALRRELISFLLAYPMSPMTATLPSTFEIKSANLPLVALLLKSGDLAAVSREMALRFGDIPDFFDQDALVIDLSPLQSTAELDFSALIALLVSYRLAPIAVKGGSPAQMAAAKQVGLLPAPDAHLTTPRPAPASAEAAAAEQPAQQLIHAAPLGALVIDKPLRSGQQVYARGRDLVVLAMVNAGAEVIADGHIHVYAPLRGKAIAGARGNTDARIFALALEAELLSIAGTYRTSENPLPPDVAGLPAQVRLVEGPDGEKLVMTAMS